MSAGTASPDKAAPKGPAGKKAPARKAPAKKVEGAKPPKAVSEAAARGLALREEHGRGGTDVGLRRAKGLAEGRPVGAADLRKIASYFARHAVDKKAPGFDDAANPSAGAIAWLLWGGDPGRRWAEREVAKLEKAAGD